MLPHIGLEIIMATVLNIEYSKQTFLISFSRLGAR
jgi:hypothetical protein